MDIINKEKALEYLKSGKIIIFPTETSYGLGCDAANQEAVGRIFKIKGRRPDKPLLVVVPTIEMAKEYLEWNENLDRLSKRWPGPLTVVAEYKKFRNKEIKKLSDGVVGQDNTVAVRVTNAEIPKYLSESLGRPVVATSANLADAGDVYSSQELIKVYENREFQPDAIVDFGILPPNPPTTIVSVVGEELKVLRQGVVVIPAQAGIQKQK